MLRYTELRRFTLNKRRMTALEFLKAKNLVTEGFTKFFINLDGVEFDLGEMLDEYAMLKNKEKKPTIAIIGNGFEHIQKIQELMEVSNVFSPTVSQVLSLYEPPEVSVNDYRIHDFPVIETLPNYFEGRKKKPKNPDWQNQIKKLTKKGN